MLLAGLVCGLGAFAASGAVVSTGLTSTEESSFLRVERQGLALVDSTASPAVVEVATADADASEPLPGKPNPGVFVIKRLGRTDVDLPVYYKVSGSAQAGVDYEKLVGKVTIPKGKTLVEVVVTPSADGVVEGDESVVLSLEPIACITIFPPPATCYTIGANAEAKILIRDLTVSPVAKLAIENPRDGAVFQELSPIAIDASAVDSSGYISRVEFYSGADRIGVSELTFIVAPKPGEQIKHSFVWKTAKAGKYELSVRAVDSLKREVRSAAVTIAVEAGAVKPKQVLNVNFGFSSEKRGSAATGFGDADYWNGYVAPGTQMGSLKGLKWADGGGSDISMTVTNAAGQWSNATGDAMYDSYVYPNGPAGDGVGSIGVTLAGVPAGVYDLYLYGKCEPAGRPESDSIFTLEVAGQKRGPLGTLESYGWKATQPWVEGVQYVRFRGIELKAGQTVQIKVDGGFDGRSTEDQRLHPSILNGLQLVSWTAVPTPVNQPPKIELTKPKTGEVFTSPSDIVLEAVAVDPDGVADRVEFYVDEKNVGESQIKFVLPGTPGVPYTHSFVWKGALVGTHAVVAKVTDLKGATTSSGVTKIEVKAAVAVAVAVRTLPKTYTPGQTIQVKVKLTPPRGTMAQALEDGVPLGWTVARVSEGGVFDLVTRQVKFGPFFDATVRTLTYDVVAPNELGTYKFVGQAGMGTVRYGVEGDNVTVGSFPFHPADRAAQDRTIGLLELTAYGAAWKAGAAWPVGPNPIPASYVTKAAALWKGGERYDVNPNGVAPAWWVSAPIALPSNPVGVFPGPTIGSLANVGTLVFGSVVTATNAGEGFVLLSPAPVDGSATGTTAVSSVTPLGLGGGVQVTVQVQPQPTASSYAVAEGVPLGWSVEYVSEGGAFDRVNRQVKWLFMDATARRLSYVVRAESAGAGAGARLSGLVSVDGVDLEVVGERGLSLNSTRSDRVQVLGFQLTSNGVAALVLQGEVGVKVRVEVTSDLRHWESVYAGELTAEESVVVDESAEGQAARFYRIVTEP